RCHEGWFIGRHTRAGHDQIGRVERRLRVTTEFHVDPRVPQRVSLREVVAPLRQHHPRTSSLQQLCCGDSTSCRSHHHHAPPSHRKFFLLHAITAVCIPAPSPQLQGRETEEREDHGDDQKPGDHLWLAPPEQLEVM